MKKIFALILVAFLLFSLVGCKNEPSAEEILTEFVRAYGAEGTVYSPNREMGEEGYVPEGMAERIYLYSGDFPGNYALFLNTHSHKGSECGIFVCSDAQEAEMVSEMCIERANLAANRKEDVVIIRSGSIIAYSTFEDSERVKELLSKIISRLS